VSFNSVKLAHLGHRWLILQRFYMGYMTTRSPFSKLVKQFPLSYPRSFIAAPHSRIVRYRDEHRALFLMRCISWSILEPSNGSSSFRSTGLLLSPTAVSVWATSGRMCCHHTRNLHFAVNIPNVQDICIPSWPALNSSVNALLTSSESVTDYLK
jgi:hypothetical protein